MSEDTNARSQLRSFVDRVERLEEEEAALASDKKQVYAEASSRGFDAKILRKVIKLRKVDRIEREEEQALVEVYMAALGMLDGTPLGDAARSRLTGPQPGDDADSPPVAGPDGPAADSVIAARAEGAEACREGKRVIDNPYVAGDPRRAAWDEGWCTEAGSDGMDVPAAWRRTRPAKPPKGGEGGEAGAPGDDAPAPEAPAPGGDA